MGPFQGIGSHLGPREVLLYLPASDFQVSSETNPKSMQSCHS